VNGVKEVILHEETGLLVPPHDPQALATAIDRLVVDRELAERLGAGAQAKAKALMDSEQMISAIEHLYDELGRRQIWPKVPNNTLPQAMGKTSQQA
jgi:glycosyltransferase involved in cell wall biosynthesis